MLKELVPFPPLSQCPHSTEDTEPTTCHGWNIIQQHSLKKYSIRHTITNPKNITIICLGSYYLYPCRESNFFKFTIVIFPLILPPHVHRCPHQPQNLPPTPATYLTVPNIRVNMVSNCMSPLKNWFVACQWADKYSMTAFPLHRYVHLQTHRYCQLSSSSSSSLPPPSFRWYVKYDILCDIYNPKNPHYHHIFQCWIANTTSHL
jgi:hypothetical protein